MMSSSLSPPAWLASFHARNGGGGGGSGMIPRQLVVANMVDKVTTCELPVQSDMETTQKEEEEDKELGKNSDNEHGGTIANVVQSTTVGEPIDEGTNGHQMQQQQQEQQFDNPQQQQQQSIPSIISPTTDNNNSPSQEAQPPPVPVVHHPSPLAIDKQSDAHARPSISPRVLRFPEPPVGFTRDTRSPSIETCPVAVDSNTDECSSPTKIAIDTSPIKERKRSPSPLMRASKKIALKAVTKLHTKRMKKQQAREEAAATTTGSSAMSRTVHKRMHTSPSPAKDGVIPPFTLPRPKSHRVPTTDVPIEVCHFCKAPGGTSDYYDDDLLLCCDWTEEKTHAGCALLWHRECVPGLMHVPVGKWTCPAHDPTYGQPCTLSDLPRFTLTPSEEQDISKYLDMDICILRGPLDKIAAVDSKMMPKVMQETHGNDMVDVLVAQDPDAYKLPCEIGLRVRKTLAEYITYHHNMQQKWNKEHDVEAVRIVLEQFKAGTTTTTTTPSPIHHLITSACGTDKEGVGVDFCVNVDVNTWEDVVQELRHILPRQVLWGDADDALTKLPQGMSIPGMSLPQLYIKVPGVWTGGHEENSRFHSINNNHGPGTSIWGAVPVAHAGRMRRLIMAHYDVDLYKFEGLWFPPVQFLLEHGIPVYVGEQRMGDTVVLDGACPHWVKSAGFAVNTSWNFGVNTVAEFKHAIERNQINDAMGIRSIVPINAVAMNVLSGLPNKSNDLAKFLKRHLLEVAGREAHKREVLKTWNIPIVIEPDDSLVCVCDVCNCEVLHYYCMCKTCTSFEKRAEKPMDLPQFYCVDCAVKHLCRKDDASAVVSNSVHHHRVEGRMKTWGKDQQTNILRFLRSMDGDDV